MIMGLQEKSDTAILISHKIWGPDGTQELILLILSDPQEALAVSPSPSALLLKIFKVSQQSDNLFPYLTVNIQKLSLATSLKSFKLTIESVFSSTQTWIMKCSSSPFAKTKHKCVCGYLCFLLTIEIRFWHETPHSNFTGKKIYTTIITDNSKSCLFLLLQLCNIFETLK